jgi:YozE SAM-like fold
MTLLEFIKSKFFDNSELGTLAKDIVNDPEFPAYRSENEIIGYLDNKTKKRGTNAVLNRFLGEFKKKIKAEYNQLYHYNIEKYVVL